MRVFVTGATGFVGSAIVQELLQAGHQVTGLVRSEEAARALIAYGAQAHRGDMENPESLRSAAASSDAVIHTAFKHDFANYGAVSELDRRAIETLGEALAGSRRPLLVTSGSLIVVPKGPLATEEDGISPDFPRKSEEAALALAERDIAASIVRLPPSVHGKGDHGFIPRIISIAREKGVSAYIEDGLNRWPAVHRLDAARLYRLAIEKGLEGIRYHGIADQGIPFREIAEVVGRRLNLPVVRVPKEEAAAHFGWMAPFIAMDGPASSAQTQELLGWEPREIGLTADLDQPHYFEA